MKKPLEVGDRVTVETTVKIRNKEATVYLDGILVEYYQDGKEFLVECRFKADFNAPIFRDWWAEDKITSKHFLNSDQYLFEKAEKVKASEYEGLVYRDDQFFDSLLDFQDYCECEVEEVDYVWAASCKPVLINPDLPSYMSELLDDAGYEGLSEKISFKPLFKELIDLQDRFVKLASEQFVYYEVDYNKAILL